MPMPVARAQPAEITFESTNVAAPFSTTPKVLVPWLPVMVAGLPSNCTVVAGAGNAIDLPAVVKLVMSFCEPG